MKKIAICFYGITRSLTYTNQSIFLNVINPARELGDVKIFGHFFQQIEIDNPRSGEVGVLRDDEYSLLPFDYLNLERPDDCLKIRNFKQLSSHGDAWGDGYKSLRNLIHQLHSLEHVTVQASLWGADVFVFVRPDLMYHDSLKGYIKSAISKNVSAIYTPGWQQCGGLNDRFSICTDRISAEAYGFRIRDSIDFCEKRKSPLQGEKLVSFISAKHKIKSIPMGARASRVRYDGTVKFERFDKPIVNKAKRIIVDLLKRLQIWRVS